VNLFREAHGIFDLDDRAVVKYAFAAETSEDLVLI
jgi:hypothetical protein